MPQCVEERPIEMFGMMRSIRLVKLKSGDLVVFRLVEPANDETIIRLFKRQERELEITEEQFFYGFNSYPATIGYTATIGFVRLSDKEVRICEHIGDLWTCPQSRQVYRMRATGTDIFAPASQAPDPPSWRKTTIIRF